MTWIQRKQSDRNRHKLVVDVTTSETVCIYHGVECLNKKKNKYHANKQEYNGILYDSQKEAKYAGELDYRLRAKDIKGYRRQVCISFDLCARCHRLCSRQCRLHRGEGITHITNYYIDFVVDETDGTQSYTEVKGQELEPWKLKWRLLESLYSGDETKTLLLVK